MKNFASSIGSKMSALSAGIGKNQYIQALTAGMMAIMPITLGTAAFAILANLPIEAWQNFIIDTGLHGHAMDLLAATGNLTALYIGFTIAFHFAKSVGESGVTAGVLSVASFITLMPQTVVAPDGTSIEALGANFLGSEGIFVSMITALVIARLYTWLMSKNMKLKLPPSVPPMVSDSLSPTFVSMIIFAFVFVVRVAVGATDFGNLFDLVTQTVSRPILAFGATPGAVVAVFTIITFAWFFGIHPSPMMSVYIPVMMAAGLANREAFMAGEPLPFIGFSAMLSIIAVGGTGGTLGLAFIMLTAKSERFKALGKISLIPGIFNINEPFIFGVPIMLNPIFLIPMVLAVPVSGLIVYIFYLMGAYNNMNPMVQMPWIMPHPITQFLIGGVSQMIAMLSVVAALTLLYFPFFKIADKQALAEEKANAAELEVEEVSTENAKSSKTKLRTN